MNDPAINTGTQDEAAAKAWFAQGTATPPAAPPQTPPAAAPAPAGPAGPAPAGEAGAKAWFAQGAPAAKSAGEKNVPAKIQKNWAGLPPPGNDATDQDRAAWWEANKNLPGAKNFRDLLYAFDAAPTWTHWVPGAQTGQQAIGGMGEVAKDIQGGMDIARKMMGLPPREVRDPNDVIGQLAKHKTSNTAQSAGAVQENLGELFSAEELIGLLGKGGRILSAVDQMKKASSLAQLFEEFPLLPKLVSVGAASLRQGLLGAGQTFLKTGGNVGAAAETGLTTAGISALIGAPLAGAAHYMEPRVGMNVPGTETVEGETFETPPGEQLKPTPNQAAGQRVITKSAKKTVAGHLEELNESRREPPSRLALPSRTGPFVFRIPPESPTAPIEAQGTTGTISPTAHPLPGSTATTPAHYAGPFVRSTEGGVSAERRLPNYMHPATEGSAVDTRTDLEKLTGEGPKPVPFEPGKADVFQAPLANTTQDPLVARAHLHRLDSIIQSEDFSKLPEQQQRVLQEQSADMRQQLNQYYNEILGPMMGHGRAQLPEVNIPREVTRVGSYTDAAQLLKRQAQSGYNGIYDALVFSGHSPQQLNQVRASYRGAESAFMAAETPEALNAAEGQLEAAHNQLSEMVKKIPSAVSVKEFGALNDAYRNALALQKFARAVDSSFTGLPTSQAARAGEYYGFNGDQLRQNLESYMKTMGGRGAVDRLVGRKQMDALLRVANLNSTNAGRKAWGAAVQEVAKSYIVHTSATAAGGLLGRMTGMGWEAGALTGLVGVSLLKGMNNVILTNPKLAEQLLFAVESGARPEKYGPFIATLVRQFTEESDRKRQEGNNNGNTAR